MPDLHQHADDLSTVAAFLAARPVPSLTPAALEAHTGRPKTDCLILLGNAVLDTIDTTAAAIERDMAERVMLVGGIGHSTAHLRDAVRADPRYDEFVLDDRPEAVIMNELLVRWYGLDADAFVLETTSTNCGANAEEAHRLLQDVGASPRDIVLIQDPTMQRRAAASFRRVWGVDDDTRFINAPPFVPSVTVADGQLVIDGPAAGRWPIERFIELVMGEIPRLRNDEHGYGPRGAGYIAAVDIPPVVAAAYQRLLEPFGECVRWPPA